MTPLQTCKILNIMANQEKCVRLWQVTAEIKPWSWCHYYIYNSSHHLYHVSSSKCYLHSYFKSNDHYQCAMWISWILFPANKYDPYFIEFICQHFSLYKKQCRIQNVVEENVLRRRSDKPNNTSQSQLSSDSAVTKNTHI